MAFSTAATGTTTSTERMRVAQSGNVLIGTTTDGGTNKLQVSGTISATTPTSGANNTQVATTAFVATSYAPLASPVFTGYVTGSGGTYTPSGSTLAGATQLAAQYSILTTASAAGVKLPTPGNLYAALYVMNQSGNTQTVYPPTSSGTINGGTAGAGVSISNDATLIFVYTATNTFFSH